MKVQLLNSFYNDQRVLELCLFSGLQNEIDVIKRLIDLQKWICVEHELFRVQDSDEGLTLEISAKITLHGGVQHIHINFQFIQSNVFLVKPTQINILSLRDSLFIVYSSQFGLMVSSQLWIWIPVRKRVSKALAVPMTDQPLSWNIRVGVYMQFKRYLVFSLKCPFISKLMFSVKRYAWEDSITSVLYDQ